MYKYVKFGYYQLLLNVDNQRAKSWCQSNPHHAKKILHVIKTVSSRTLSLEFDKIITAIQSGKLQANQVNNGKMAEIDATTLKVTTDSIFYQITNFRDSNIPSITAPGKERQEIELNDDEYIGEFLSIIMHRSLNVIMMQHNRYALTHQQVEDYLSSLFFSFYKVDPIVKDFMQIKLVPIIDPGQLKKINGKTAIRKIRIRGSEVSLRNLLPNNAATAYQINSLLEEIGGIEFDITITANYTKKNPIPLNVDRIIEMLPAYTESDKSALPEIETSSKPEHGPSESINWLIPSMSTIIRFVFESRKPMGYEYVYALMKERYDDEINHVIQIVIGD